MSLAIGNLFNAIPGDIDREIITDILRGDGVRIERIISKGQSSPESGWYDQQQHEWVVVLSGEAKIMFENNDCAHLIAGSYLTIPAHTKHRVSWTKPDIETVWLAVHYN